MPTIAVTFDSNVVVIALHDNINAVASDFLLLFILITALGKLSAHLQLKIGLGFFLRLLNLSVKRMRIEHVLN